MDNVNKKTLDYFDKIIKNLPKIEDNIMAEGELKKGKTQLFNTDKEARTDARVQALIEGKPFDESETPPEELETVDDDMITRIIERKLDMIVGD